MDECQKLWDGNGQPYCSGSCLGISVRSCIFDSNDNCVCTCGVVNPGQCTGWCPGADDTCFFDSNQQCRCARVGGEEKKESNDIDPTIQLLVNRQTGQLPGVRRELNSLQEGGQKQEHWIWWVFPGTQEGRAEPSHWRTGMGGDRNLYGVGKTKVTLDTAQQLLNNAPVEWRLALEQICRLITNRGYQAIFPWQDWGRIAWFYDFWCSVPNLPQWMIDVLLCLKNEGALKYGVRQGYTPTINIYTSPYKVLQV